MNVIVSTNAIDYSDSGFIKVKTLQEVENLTGTIKFLVYHKSNEKSKEKLESLTRLKSKVTNFIYVSSKDKIDTAIEMIIVGLGGKIIDDEFFITSSLELSNLVSSLDTVVAIKQQSGVSILDDFFDRYLKNGDTGFTNQYLSLVKDAVSAVITDCKQKDLRMVQMSETATDLFSNSIEVVTRIDEEREKLKAMVSSYKNQSQYISETTSQLVNPSILYYPRVSYLKTKNIFRIKELGNFAFLTSFMLGYRLFLSKVKYTRPRLIFIMPMGDMYREQYKDFYWLSTSSKSEDSASRDVVFTSTPSRELLYRLLDDNNYDTVIIVDRMKSASSHILNSKGSNILYAVSGQSCLNRYNIPQTSFFSNSPIKGSRCTISEISNYPSSKEQREILYLETFRSAYEALYVGR